MTAHCARSVALSFATLVIVVSRCIFPCFGVASCIAIFRLFKGFLTAEGVYKEISQVSESA